MQVLISLHDVTPAHRHRLERADLMFADLGVSRVSYFVVPNFHGMHPLRCDSSFADWCTRPRPFEVDWVLHGYYHLETGRPPASPTAAVKRALLTGGEGEFLSLTHTMQRERLLRGLATLKDLGMAPDAFVPPAWLSNRHLHLALREVGLTYTEDHWFVTDVTNGTRRLAPAIAWATRSMVHRVGSRLVCPLAARLTAALQAVRIAVHPHDLDHPATRAQIHDVVRGALRYRSCASYRALFTSPCTRQ